MKMCWNKFIVIDIKHPIFFWVKKLNGPIDLVHGENPGGATGAKHCG